MKALSIIFFGFFCSITTFAQSNKNINRITNEINSFQKDCLFGSFGTSEKGSGILDGASIRIDGGKETYNPDRIIFPINGVEYCMNPDRHTLTIVVYDETSPSNIAISGQNSCNSIEFSCSDDDLICEMIKLFTELKSEFDNNRNICEECE